MIDIKKKVLDKLDHAVNEAQRRLERTTTPEAIAEATQKLEREKKRRDRYIRENAPTFPKRNRQRKIAEIVEE